MLKIKEQKKRSTSPAVEKKPEYNNDLEFYINGKKHHIVDPDPTVLLVDYLRSTEVGLTGTKHSCGQGGCGACTVMLSYWDEVTKKAVNVSCNSCLRPIVALDGMEITTVEGLGSVDTEVSPVQHCIAKNNGSQCGYCTPGFVMNMHSLLIENEKKDLTKKEIEQSFDGNICRCTGFRPILYGMKTFASDWTKADAKGTPECFVDPAEEVKFYKKPKGINVGDLKKKARTVHYESQGVEWYRPLTLQDVHALMNRFKGQKEIRLVCGNTSQGIPAINPVDPQVMIDISHVNELKQTSVTDKMITVGAAVTYTGFLNIINVQLKKATPAKRKGLKALHYMALRTAGKIVRNVASLAGNTMLVARNVKSGYPFPSDLFMGLSAIGTTLSVSVDGKMVEIAILDFIQLYNSDKAFSQQAIIVAYHIPYTTANDFIQTYKVALRTENSHSLANAGFKITLGKGKKITASTLVMGGIATQPYLAVKTQNYLLGKPVDEKTMKGAIKVLTAELEAVVKALPKWYKDLPTEGVSNSYRISLLQSYLYKFFIEVLKEIKPSSIPKVDLSAPATAFDRPVSKGQQHYKNYKQEFPVSVPFIKLSAFEQATGEAVYTHDIPVPVKGLQGAFVTGQRALAKFSYKVPAANGKNKKSTIDEVLQHVKTKFPEVVDYITYRDIPKGGANGSNNPYAPDPWFCENSITCYGQCIGLVLAETERSAINAAQYISDNCLAYVESKPVLEIRDAVKAGLLFPGYEKDDNHLIMNPGSNIAWALKTGAKGLAPGFKFGKTRLNGVACVVIAGVQQTGDQVHFYMETQSSFVTPGERQQILVQSSTQSPSSVQSAVARTLAIKESNVEVDIKRLGGAYGGKTTRTPYIAAPAALAASKWRKPVRIAMPRDIDSFMTGNRHPFLGEFNIAIVPSGPDKGKIMGTVFEFYSNGGNTFDCSFDVMDCAILGADNCYNVPNFQTQGNVAKTNRSSNGAMRSYGGVQCGLITEEAIEAAAHKIGMRGEDIREKNFYVVGDKTPYGQSLEYCIIGDVWKRLKKTSDFENRFKAVEKFNSENKWKKRGISMIPLKYGLGYNLGFLMQGGATIDIYVGDGSVLVSHGGVEMGQGIWTKVAQVAAEALNIPLALIEMDNTRTSVIPNATGTGATSGSDLNGGAVRQACTIQRTKLEAMCLMLKQTKGAGWCKKNNINYWDYKTGWNTYVKDPATGKQVFMWNSVISQANQNRVDLSSQTLYSTPGLANSLDQQFYGFTYSACCSEVEIDVLTGEFNIVRADVLYDIGKSLNPAIDIGQIEGAFVMGVGNVTTEKVVWEPPGTPNPTGMLNTPNTWTYKPPCAATIPIDFRVDLFPREDASEVPENPNLLMSSKGVGEPPLVLANTVFFAIKRAVLAARKDRGHHEWFEMESPAVVEEIRNLCLVDVKDLAF